jgi:hypothetical protein
MVEQQVRVEQSKEPEEFLNLFQAHYVIHANTTGVKLYDVRDGIPVECERKYTHICQHACHVIRDDTTIILWQGKHCPAAERNLAKETVNNMFGENFILIEEGVDDEQFLQYIEGDRQDMFEFPTVEQVRKPRFYIVDEATGVNTVTEVTLSQENFESEKCYLIDATGKTGIMYAWIGRSVSAALKKFTLQTCVEYSQVSKPTQQLVVNENYEPTALTIQFHSWTTESTSYKSRKNVKRTGPEIKNPEVITTVEEQLENLQTKVYPYSVLMSGKLPEGVDSTVLEIYLSDEEFIKVFKMNREQWAKTPSWQKVNKKKEVNLF